MSSREEANRIYSKFLSAFGGVNIDKEHRKVVKYSIIAVDEIINALKITTGHLELRRLDENEVDLDFKYWEQVKKHLKEF